VSKSQVVPHNLDRAGLCGDIYTRSHARRVFSRLFQQRDRRIGYGCGHEEEVPNIGREVFEPIANQLVERARYRQVLAWFRFDLAAQNPSRDFEGE